MKLNEKIKKIISSVGLVIGGIFIAVATWFLKDLFRKDPSSKPSEEDLKESIKESKEEVNDKLDEIKEIVTKAEEIKQDVEELKKESSTENRLDTLESAGLIKRKK